MAEPKKETVRIALPPRPAQSPSPSNGGRDTARIVLPSRTPAAPVRRLPPKIESLPPVEPAAESPPNIVRRPPIAPPQSSISSALLQPLPKPPGRETSAETGATITPLPPAAGSSVQPGPKKETARISILPKPISAPKPPVNMTKTQPLLIRPAPGMQPAPVIIAPKPIDAFEAIPKSFCWGLFGIAALIFLIQILNYVVS